MDREMQEAVQREPSWQEAHSWLNIMSPEDAEADSIGEEIRYTLDELRLA